MFKPDVIKVEHWRCPKENGPAILTMPNIPRPLHGLCPRTILTKSTWDFMRKKCYMDAGYKCEICGEDLSDGRPESHELYSYEYTTQTAVFARTICLCKKCHGYFIHSGRALTLYKQGNPLFTKERLMEGVEQGFTIINSYNEAHPLDEPLRVYSAILDYAKQPELKEEMEALIQKYNIKFYTIPEKWWNKKNWGEWKLVIGNKFYRTPYGSMQDWQSAMDKKSQEEGDAHTLKDPFSGDTYDAVRDLLKKG